MDKPKSPLHGKVKNSELFGCFYNDISRRPSDLEFNKIISFKGGMGERREVKKVFAWTASAFPVNTVKFLLQLIVTSGRSYISG